jgi:chromate transporter
VRQGNRLKPAAAATILAAMADEKRLGKAALFLIFLRAGLAFGGGLGILAVLQHELVERRRLVERDEFLAIYGIGRIVPSGTMTALAVAYGHRFGGHVGVALALSGLVLPAFVLTIALTAAYGLLSHGPWMDLLRASLLPAALALIVSAAIRLGRPALGLETALAAAALVGALVLGANAALLLLAGGAVGAAFLGANGKNGR